MIFEDKRIAELNNAMIQREEYLKKIFTDGDDFTSGKIIEVGKVRKLLEQIFPET